MKMRLFVKVKQASHEYGPYTSKQDAEDARKRIATQGDSLGFKYPKSDTYIVEKSCTF
jgi:hypothetical protein